MGGRLQTLWLALPLVAALVAHAPALDNDFVNWDDPQYLLDNPLTEAPFERGVAALLVSHPISYPVPITLLSYAAQRRAFAIDDDRFGLDARGFHAVSLALHLAVVLLLIAVARRFEVGLAPASAAAALVAAHPLAVEPVAWVVGQKDLLAALFALAAIWVRAGPRGDDLPRSFAAAGLAALAIGAKPSAVAVPVLLAGVDVVRGRSLRAPRALALYGGLGALALADVALALAGHDERGVSPTSSFGLGSLAEAGWAYALQIGHVVAPRQLTVRYFPPQGAWLAVHAALGAALAGLTAAGAYVAWRRGAAAVAFGIGGALVAYLPASGILPLPRGPADVYVYLPLALAALAAARGLELALSRTAGAKRAALAAALGAVILAGAFGSRQQARVWSSSTALWRPAAVAYPDEPEALGSFGSALLFDRALPEAIATFADVSVRFPEHLAHLQSYGDALMLTGRFAAAERVYARAARAGLDESDEVYALYLIGQPQLEPSDPKTAAAALRAMAPALAERGKRAPSLDRAATLLERYGAADLAAAVRARAAAIRRRNP